MLKIKAKDGFEYRIYLIKNEISKDIKRKKGERKIYLGFARPGKKLIGLNLNDKDNHKPKKVIKVLIEEQLHLAIDNAANFPQKILPFESWDKYIDANQDLVDVIFKYLKL